VSADVHSTAVIHVGARLAADAVIGPYCVVGDRVEIGAGAVIRSHAVIEGPTQLDSSVQVHPFAVVGGAPQDKSYRGEHTELVVGESTVIREHVTIHRGTTKDRGQTRVGRRCLLMVGAHVAHDVIVGDDCIVSNHCELAGHVVLEEGVVLGGAAAIAPFVRVGRFAFIAAGARVEQSVPPFLIAQGDRAVIRGINVVGLRRNGVAETSIDAITRAYKKRYLARDPSDALLAELAADDDPYVRELAAFLRSHVTAPAAR